MAVLGTGVVLAAHDMPAESRRAAAFDRAHHLELAEADVAAVDVTPSGPVVTEDIRDLQRRARHGASAGRPALLELGCDMLQRAPDLADYLGGDTGIERRGIELGVAERTRAIVLPFYVIESQSAAEQDRVLADDARRSARDKRQCPRP